MNREKEYERARVVNRLVMAHVLALLVLLVLVLVNLVYVEMTWMYGAGIVILVCTIGAAVGLWVITDKQLDLARLHWMIVERKFNDKEVERQFYVVHPYNDILDSVSAQLREHRPRLAHLPDKIQPLPDDFKF